MTDHETNCEDSTLVALAQTGSASAMDQLVRKYWPVAYRTAAGMLHRHADAEEIAQDTLWSAMTHLSSFRGGASFRTWLHRIAINHSLMFLRRRRNRAESISRAPFDVVALFPSGSATPEDLLLEAESHRLIKEDIERLPDSYAMVLRLSALEERSTNETATHVGISVPGVKSRLRRGRALLRRRFSQRWRLSLTAEAAPGKLVQKTCAPASLLVHWEYDMKASSQGAVHQADSGRGGHK
jgi:RNA polymerase sigma-70 factor (ECF subfamily)